MKPGDRVRSAVTSNGCAGTVNAWSLKAGHVRVLWDGEDGDIAVKAAWLRLEFPGERALEYVRARRKALDPLSRVGFDLAVWTLGILLGGCLVIGYARLWYYWFEFVFTGHIVLAAGYLAWVLRK
jgi:hypothetical protein